MSLDLAPDECEHEWTDRPRYGSYQHHQCAEPAGHLDDHVCSTCGRSAPNTAPWRA